MNSFALDENGDILIENNEISMVSGDELMQQNVRTILQTNLGEWFFDQEQGIDFDSLLGKGVNEEVVRFEIERGLAQVDSTFRITDFSFEVDKETRTAIVSFKAQTDEGDEVGGEYTWD